MILKSLDLLKIYYIQRSIKIILSILILISSKLIISLLL